MNTVETISSVVTLIAAIVGAVAGAFGVITYFTEAKRKKQLTTLESYKQLQTEVFVKLNVWKGKTVTEAVETADSVGYSELVDCLARIEHFCVGINQGTYDFETFYQMGHGYFDNRLKRLLKPLLDKKLNQFANGENYYNNLTAVWARMEERSKKSL